MTGLERGAVDEYLRRVAYGLRGLPQADIDDTIAEMRAHILEESAERGDAGRVLADFGGAAEVASAIIERLLRPENGPGVPPAPFGQRYSAWATDVVLGFGPVLLVPTALTFVAAVLGRFGEANAMPIWIQLSEHVANWWLKALGYTWLPRPAPVSLWQLVLATGLLAWAAFYWLALRRSSSASVGMWMTGLRGVRVNDERVVVRERDVAQTPRPLGADGKRWWVLVPILPVGCLCVLLAIYYLWMCIGPFLPPRVLG